MNAAAEPVLSVRSFAPLGRRSARVLVLGSMPGEESLRAGRYYAYRHNAFWPIMGELLGAGPELDYDARVRRLERAGLALWDVMESCVREGSLDSSIDEASIVPNDFAAFFASHPRIRHVFFNGSKAEHCFNRHVRPALAVQGLSFTRLPSTSPAHASLSMRKKLEAWRAVAQTLEKTGERGKVKAESEK